MSRRNIVVFSGGSAANNLVDVFGKLASDKDCSLSYIIPISDNGGSSSELIRVFGGPGIGDIRSRLIRLIPSSPNTPSSTAIKTLFNHRLTSTSPTSARNEWLDIVEARHPLWHLIPSQKRELIRSFLNTINLEIVKRARPSSVFNFQSASVGNLFLTGARLFTGSFESAIYLLGAITGVPADVNVIPAINSNFTHHISAGLRDGTVITGQNAISHPTTTASALPYSTAAPTPIPAGTPTTEEEPQYHNRPADTSLTSSNIVRDPLSHEPPSIIHHPSPSDNDPDPDNDKIEDANLPGSHPSLRLSSLHFSKTHTTALPSPISRIWYINPYGQEIIPAPAPNPKVVQSISDASCVVYSIGSLYTSIVPCLVLRGVGAVIRESRGVRWKVLVLNGCVDRETGGYGAWEFVEAIVGACVGSSSSSSSFLNTSISKQNKVPKEEWRNYVTHVIYLAGEGTPRVQREALAELGIECVRVYGRRNSGEGGGMVYDGVALGGALEAIVGKGSGDGRTGEKSRRNTLGISGVVG